MTTQYGPLTDIPVKLEIVNSAYLVEDATYANLATVSKTTVSNTYVLQYQTGVTFDISSEFANGLYVSGTPKAFVISLSDEDSNYYCYPINSSEVTNVSLRPNLTVRYGYTLPAGLADGEVISIENVGSGGYLYPHSGFIGDGTNILHSYASNLSKAYQFILEKNSETGGYSLRHNYDPSVNAKITADPSRRVVFGRTDNAQTQEWLIVPYDNDTFKIVLRSDMRLCLTAVGTPSSSNSDTSITTNGHVIVSMSMTPAQDNQLWYIVENGTYLTTGNASSVLKTGDYYFNNAYTGKFLHRSGNTTVNGQSGLLSSLGESSIKWRVTNLEDGYCTIQRADMPNAFLAADSTSGSTVKIKQNNSETISDIYKWEIRIATGGGCLIKSKYTGKYLYSAESSSSSSSVYVYGLYSSGSTSYDKQRWRVVEASQYVELNSNTVFEDMSLDLNDVKSPNIDKKPSNASWATISDFYYQTSSSKVEINNTSIVGKETGSASITAVHKVTGRSYNFNVTVYKGTLEVTFYAGNSSIGIDEIQDLLNMGEIIEDVSIFGHCWIGIQNNTCNTITIGAYPLFSQETVFIGLWGNQINDSDGDYTGMWYNREFYEYEYNNKYHENVYYSVEVSKSSVSQMNMYISANYNGYNFFTKNCVDFAVGFWNNVVPSEYIIDKGIDFSNSPWEMIDQLKDQFANYSSNDNLINYGVNHCGFYNGEIYISHTF